MTRGTRGSSFNNKTSGLERAKDQNPFGAGGRGFSLPANYKQTEADAFEGSGAKVSDYYKPSKDATTKFEYTLSLRSKRSEGKSVSFLKKINWILTYH